MAGVVKANAISAADPIRVRRVNMVVSSLEM
jgi:hypothetical protein